MNEINYQAQWNQRPRNKEQTDSCKGEGGGGTGWKKMKGLDKTIYAWPMDVHSGVGIAWGIGVVGWRGAKGEHWDNCNSINNETLKLKQQIFKKKHVGKKVKMESVEKYCRAKEWQHYTEDLEKGVSLENGLFQKKTSTNLSVEYQKIGCLWQRNRFLKEKKGWSEDGSNCHRKGCKEPETH